jgi:phytol kinase
MNPALCISLVLITLGAVMGGVRAGQKRLGWHPEISRKLVHIAMGLICLSFPWLFEAAWPVWLLAAGAMVSLGAIRVLPLLKKRFGQVLGGVERESWGELMFPLAVAFIFSLAHGQTILFVVPVLTLTLADAVAALIGQRYGQVRYETDDGWKSIEGSTTFFIAAFLSTHVPVLLFTNVGRLECLLIAGIMGLILVLMEAIAWRGLDNLFIPLVSYVCLVQMMELSASALLTRLVVLLALLASLCGWKKATRLTQSAVIGAALILYVTWAVGDWHWLIAPLMTAAAYTLLCQRPTSSPQRHTVHAIACVGGIGLIWLCLLKTIDKGNVIYAYGVGYGANLGMIALAHFADHTRSRSWLAVFFKSIVLGYLPLAVPYLIVWRHNSQAVPLALGALVLVGIALGGFALWQPMLGACPADARRWDRQGMISAAASGLAFALISLL